MTTPLEPAPASLSLGHPVWLKREDAHELGAFKWRAALPVVERYRDEGARRVVTASTGNHGVATSWAAQRLGLKAVIFAPEGASRSKLAQLEQLDADVRLGGADVDEAKEAGKAYAHEHGLPFFEDGAEPLQYEAYGAIGDEILDRLDEAPGAVVVPVGNGALLGGIGRALGRGSPSTLRVGVAAKEAPAMALSFDAGRPVESDRCATIAEAVAAFDRAGIRAEAAAGAGLAAVGQLEEAVGPIVMVVTGGNIDPELLARCRDEPGSFPD